MQDLLYHLFLKLFAQKKAADPILEGIFNFLRESQSTEERLHVAEVWVKCIGHSDWHVIMMASICLREYYKLGYKLPQNTIDALMSSVNIRSIRATENIIKTLGCMSCTKPFLWRLFHERESGFDLERWQCWKCEGGHPGELHAPKIVPRLNHIFTKSKRPKIRDASAFALGVIGYSKPDLVKDAVELLIKYPYSEHVIFAIGCIGYSRPDLVEKIIPYLQHAAEDNTNYLRFAARDALRKIGQASQSVTEAVLEDKLPIEEAMDRFFERMLYRNSPFLDESLEGIKKLVIHNPSRVISKIRSKILELRVDRSETMDLEENVLWIVKELSLESAHLLKELEAVLKENLNKYSIASPQRTYCEEVLEILRKEEKCLDW